MLEPLTTEELAELNEKALAELDRSIEEDEAYIPIKEDFLAAMETDAGPWYGVPLWLLKKLLKYLPKK